MIRIVSLSAMLGLCVLLWHMPAPARAQVMSPHQAAPFQVADAGNWRDRRKALHEKGRAMRERHHKEMRAHREKMRKLKEERKEAMGERREHRREGKKERREARHDRRKDRRDRE